MRCSPSGLWHRPVEPAGNQREFESRTPRQNLLPSGFAGSNPAPTTSLIRIEAVRNPLKVEKQERYLHEVPLERHIQQMRSVACWQCSSIG